MRDENGSRMTDTEIERLDGEQRVRRYEKIVAYCRQIETEMALIQKYIDEPEILAASARFRIAALGLANTLMHA
jgi:hypothetical protein